MNDYYAYPLFLHLTKDHFLVMFYGTKWSLCANVPLNHHPLFDSHVSLTTHLSSPCGERYSMIVLRPLFDHSDAGQSVRGCIVEMGCGEKECFGIGGTEGDVSDMRGALDKTRRTV